MRISHTETVASVTAQAGAAFRVLQESVAVPGWDINPANFVLFPWLSGIARGFEKYRFTRLSFRFVPSNPTTAPGRFYAAVDYDYNDEPASSLPTLMSNETASSASVWGEVNLNCNMRTMFAGHDYKYVSNTSRFSETEPRLTYGGFLMAAVSGTTGACTWDLVVSYSVELISPQYVDEAEAVGDMLPVGRTLPNESSEAFFWQAPAALKALFPVTRVGSKALPTLTGNDAKDAWLGFDLYGISGLPETSQFLVEVGTATYDAVAWVAQQSRVVLQIYDAAGKWLTQTQANIAPDGKTIGVGCTMRSALTVNWRDLISRFPYATYAGAFLYTGLAPAQFTRSKFTLRGI